MEATSASKAPGRSLLARIGDPVRWSGADKAVLIAAINLPFVFLYTLTAHYVLAHPEFAPYIDQRWIRWFVWFGYACAVWWALFIALSPWVKRRNSESPVYIGAMILSWWVMQGVVAYGFGPFTNPLSWQLLLAAGIIDYLLFERRYVILSLVVGFGILAGVTALEQARLIPYAPLVSSSPYVDGRLSPLWLLWLGVATFFSGALTLAICFFTIDRWHEREEFLERTHRELQDAHGELEKTRASLEERVRERTDELVRANKELLLEMEERARAEEERIQLERQLLHAQKLESLGVLAGGIAHDFNNLLMAIMGNTALAEQRLDNEREARAHLATIHQATRRAAQLTNQLLAYAGKGRLLVEPLRLSELVTEMVHLMEVSISKKATLEIRCDEETPIVDADPAQLQQVVLNLITNASDALGSSPGRIIVSTARRMVVREQLATAYLGEELPAGEYAVLEVEDTGCGISSDALGKIFDPFFTTKFAGRGLGLAAVLGIVRGHRGALRVESAPGKGTRFDILFPISEQQAPSQTSEMHRESIPWEGGGNVLVVDDEAFVRDVARATLERAGLSVRTAENGTRGLEEFRSHADEIDVVLLDLTMPDLDGEELLAEMKKIRPDVRVILSSGFSEAATSELMSGNGYAVFLQKPYPPDDLVQAVRELLQN